MSSNGFWANGFWANGLTTNGVAPSGLWLASALRPEHGLSVAAPLSSDAGLANGIGLMSTEGGRRLVSYAVKCALPAGHHIDKIDQKGNVHTFHGSIGVGAPWETGSCGESCQEWMTACLLGHVNLTGKRVTIWVTADHPAVELTRSKAFPREEASYFGNLFSASPEAYVCYGEQAMERPIPGRVCTESASCPYSDPYAADGGYCTTPKACATAFTPSGERSGYTDCRVGERTFSHVVTSWKP
jgi:hypothetical protein